MAVQHPGDQIALLLGDSGILVQKHHTDTEVVVQRHAGIAGYGAQKLPRQLDQHAATVAGLAIRSDRAPGGSAASAPRVHQRRSGARAGHPAGQPGRIRRNRVQNQDDAMFSRTWLISGDQTPLAYMLKRRAGVLENTFYRRGGYTWRTTFNQLLLQGEFTRGSQIIPQNVRSRPRQAYFIPPIGRLSFLAAWGCW